MRQLIKFQGRMFSAIIDASDDVKDINVVYALLIDISCILHRYNV